MDGRAGRAEGVESQRPRSLEPIDYQGYVQGVENDVSQKQNDFSHRLELEDAMRKRVPVESKPAPIIVKKRMPPPRPKPAPIVQEPVPERTAEEYLKLEIATLQQGIRSLRKQNHEWREKFRHEAQNRTVIFDLQSNLNAVLSNEQDNLRDAEYLRQENENSRILIRRLRLQIVDLKKSVQTHEIAAINSNEIADLLYKPRFETIVEEHEALHEEHSNLREHHDQVAIELSRSKTDKQRTDRKKKVNDHVIQEVKKQKKETARRKSPARRQPKKKGKNAPPSVSEQLEGALTSIRSNRTKLPQLLAKEFYRAANATKRELDRDSAPSEDGHDSDHGAFISPPIKQSSLALPWKKYGQAAPSDMKVPLLSEKILLTFFALAANKKVKADMEITADIPITASQSFADIIFENLLYKYGSWSIAEAYVYGIVEGIRRHVEDNPRIAFFGRLLGIIDEDLYDERACTTMLKLLNSVSNGNIPISMTEYDVYDHDLQEGETDLSSFFFIPLPRAKAACQEVFQNLHVTFEQSTLYIQSLLFEKLENFILQYCIPETDSKTKLAEGSDKKIDIDSFMRTCINMWYEQSQADAAEMGSTIWKLFDCKENQAFSLDLLHHIVEFCSPADEYDADKLVPLFRQLVSCEVPRTCCINREMFVSIMMANGVTPPKHEHELPEGAEKKKKGKR